MIRGLSALALALAAAGCFSVPPFEPEGGVTYTAAGTGAIVGGPGFALRFADGPGFHFPDSLTIDGDEVIGTEADPVGCFEEDGVGLRITPALRISARGTTVPVTNVLTPVLSGPAVVQVKLDWSTGFASMSCGADRDLGGTSTFTVFPDGRIVRHDEIAYDGASIASSQCGCEQVNPGFTVATYWALARDRFRNFYNIMFDPPRAEPLPVPTDIVGANSDRSCVDAQDGRYQVAFAWLDGFQTTVRGGDQLIGFGRDLGARGFSNLVDLTETNTSILAIERTTCLDALERVDEYLRPMLLSINGGEPVGPSPITGIYGDPARVGGPFDLQGSGRATLTGAVPTSFAVWLQFPRPVGDVRARRDGAKGAWYLPQRVDDRSWIVWFRDPLREMEQIEVGPR